MKNIVVCMPMDDENQNAIIKKLGKMQWLKDAHLTLVHVFKEENYPYMAPPTIYPNKEQKVEIKKTIKEIFDGLAKDLDFKEKSSECLFHSNPKEGMVEYLKKRKQDLVISYTQEKHGLRDYFHSSFTEYLIKHSPCDVLTIR
ncbi:MAG: universal stress protein [Bacteriovoracaceae bacterium]